MKTMKNSLVGFVLLSLLIIGLATLLPRSISGQGGSQNAPPHLTPRKFYLTKTIHNGSHVLTACAAGYHTASLWEIFDVSSLRYDTELGFTDDDTGSGPPNLPGWIRTGSTDFSSSTPGIANCRVWTSESHDERGTVMHLIFEWDSTATAISPWKASTNGCDSSTLVWCVQD